MKPPAPDDRELVERARHGDVSAYGELVRRHQDQALAAAYVILGNRQEAEDATQEAFARAFLALHRFRPDGSFRAWLLRIVLNEAHDLRSARHRQAELLSRAAGRLETTTTVQSAEAAALSQQRRELLLEALFDLPEPDRLVVTCRYFLDLSEAEIAEVLGIARGTVKSRLSRALARLGPILRDLGPLVVVPPVADLQQAVVERVGDTAFAASGLSKFGSRIQHVGTAVGAGAVALVVAGVLLVSSSRGAPTAPTPQVSPPRSGIVYGGDLTDADRQELAASFGSGATATDSISRSELVETLGAQGVPVQPSDAAISSAELVCSGPGSGLEVRTHNISRLTAAVYAGALMTAGLYDALLVAAAPNDKPVSGETALVAIFKAYPTCSGGRQADPQRVRLAYQQVKVTIDIAGRSSDLTHASAVFLEVLQAVITGQAADVSGVEKAVDSAATREGLTLDNSTRAEAINLLEQLRHVDYGPYARGFVVQQLGGDRVRVMTAQ